MITKPPVLPGEILVFGYRVVDCVDYQSRQFAVLDVDPLTGKMRHEWLSMDCVNIDPSSELYIVRVDGRVKIFGF